MSFFVPLFHSLDCVFFFLLYFGTILVFSFVYVYVVVSDLLCFSFFFLFVCVLVGLSFPSFLLFFLLSMHVSSTLVVTVQAVVDDGLFFSLCTHQRVLFCTVSHTHTRETFFFSSLLYSLGFSFWLGDWAPANQAFSSVRFFFLFSRVKKKRWEVETRDHSCGAAIMLPTFFFLLHSFLSVKTHLSAGFTIAFRFPASETTLKRK